MHKTRWPVALCALFCCALASAQQPPPGTEGDQVNASLTRYESEITDGSLAGGRELRYVVRLGKLRLDDRYRYDKTGRLASARSLSHYFISPDNGGWSRWGLLRVTAATAQGKTRRLLPQYSLSSVTVLASGERALVQYVWELPPSKQQSKITPPPALYLRVLRLPHDRFTYFRVQLDHPEYKLVEVTLSGYPHSTTGERYKVRERWVASAKRTACCHQAQTFGPGEPALFLFNKRAQENCGMELVRLAEEAPQAVVAGSYAVSCTLKLSPKAQNENAVCFALSEWREAHYEPARRRFFAEDAPRVAKTLASLNWLADLSRLPDPQLVADVRELLACPELNAKFGQRCARLLEQVDRVKAPLLWPEKLPTGQLWKLETSLLNLSAELRRLALLMMRQWLDEGYWDRQR